MSSLYGDAVSPSSERDRLHRTQRRNVVQRSKPQTDRVRVDVNDIFVPCPKCGLGMHFLSDKKHDCRPELKETRERARDATGPLH